MFFKPDLWCPGTYRPLTRGLVAGFAFQGSGPRFHSIEGGEVLQLSNRAKIIDTEFGPAYKDTGGSGGGSQTLAPFTKLNNAEECSIACYARLDATTGTGGLVSIFGSGGNQFLLWADGSLLRTRVYTPGGSGQCNYSLPAPQFGRWYKLVAVYDGRTIKLYVDGVEVDSTNRTGRVVTVNQELEVGSYSNGGACYNATIGIALVYNLALTPAEVESHFGDPFQVLHHDVVDELWVAASTGTPPPPELKGTAAGTSSASGNLTDPSGVALPVVDSFNRSDRTLDGDQSDSGHTYGKLYADGWQIISNEAAPEAVTSGVWLTDAPATGDAYVKAVRAAGTRHAIMCRVTETLFWYEIAIDSAGNADVRRVKGGGSSKLADAGYVPIGGTVELRVYEHDTLDKTIVECWINDVLDTTVEDTDAARPKLGSWGMRSQVTVGGRWDDFEGGAISADRLSGTAAGTSTASGALSATGKLAGTAAGTSGASGSIVGAGLLSGTAQGTSGASGAIAADAKLSGAAAGSSTASGQLRRAGGLRGTAAGTSSATLSLGGLVNLRGAAAGSSAAAADLKSYLAASGTAAGTSTASAFLRADVALSGLAAGTSLATGRLTDASQSTTFRVELVVSILDPKLTVSLEDPALTISMEETDG